LRGLGLALALALMVPAAAHAAGATDTCPYLPQFKAIELIVA
jgi:hypothetical protein